MSIAAYSKSSEEAAALQRRRDRAAENPPGEVVHSAADFLRKREEEEFADELFAARAVWRKYPHLVEAETMPKRFEAHFERIDELEGPFEYVVSDDCMMPGWEEGIEEQARELASTWIRNGSAERDGFSFTSLKRTRELRNWSSQFWRTNRSIMADIVHWNHCS